MSVFSDLFGGLIQDTTEEKELKVNGSGCPDPTAYEAIMRAEVDAERHRKLIGCLLRICELSDFSLEERIVVRDKRTGKVWR